MTIIVAVATLTGCSTDTTQFTSAIDSRALGLSRRTWEITYGRAKWEDSGQVLFREGMREYLVWFWDGNASIIDFKNSDDSTLTLESARNESQKLIPADSKFLGSQPVGENMSDSYYSASLRGRFSEASWRSGGPGQFLVLYRIKSGAVESCVIQIGQPVGSLQELNGRFRD